MGTVCETCGAEAAAGAGTCPKCGGRLAAGVSETLPFNEEDKRRLAAIAQTVAAEPLDPKAGGGTPRPSTTLADPALAEAAPGDPSKTLALPDDQGAGAQAADSKATLVLSCISFGVRRLITAVTPCRARFRNAFGSGCPPM